MYIYVYIYIKLRGRPPIWRGGLRTYSCAFGANPDCFEHGGNVNVSMEEVLVFCWKFGTHTRWENHKWCVSIGRRWWFPLVLLFYTFLMFSGSPPLGYDVLLCF